MEPHCDLREVGIVGENVSQPQVLHDDKRRKVGERNHRLVVKPLPQSPSVPETGGGDFLEP